MFGNIFASNDKSDSDKLSGSLSAVIVLGLIATTCQGIGFLVLKPVMVAGIATVLGFLSPILVLLLLWIKERQVPHVYAFVGAILAVNGAVIIIVT